MKHGLLRKQIVIPLEGPLGNLGMKVKEWLDTVPTDQSFVFPPYGFDSFEWDKTMRPQRWSWILKKTNGLFPHYYRGLCETYLGRGVFKNNPWQLKSYMGLARLDSTASYVSAEWEERKKDFFR